MRIAVLASGEGTTLQSLMDAIAARRLDARLAVVISNNRDSGSLRRAASAKIPVAHLSAKTHPDPDALDASICEALTSAGTDVVVLAGYMKKVGPRTLSRFAGRIINTHPALLPRHGGKGMFGRRVHEAVLESGDAETGISVHLVDGEYDTGAVIAQARMAVPDRITAEALEHEVQELEREFLCATLQEISDGRLRLATAHISSEARYRAALLDLDDTIFDHQLHRREALAAVRDAIPALAGATVEELERTHDLHLQRTHRAFLAKMLNLGEARTERLRGLLSDFGVDARHDLIEAAEKSYRNAYDRQWRAVPGAPELIAALRERGVIVAVITNGRSSDQAAKIHALGLRDAIDHVFTSEAVGSEKPAREFFGHVMSRLSVTCSQCVVVGDLWDTDIQGALDSGMDAIWLNRYAHSQAPNPRVRTITSLEPTEEVMRMFLRPSAQPALDSA